VFLCLLAPRSYDCISSRDFAVQKDRHEILFIQCAHNCMLILTCIKEWELKSTPDVDCSSFLYQILQNLIPSSNMKKMFSIVGHIS